MKVLHVITGLGTGGAEIVLCRLLETLRAPEFEHVVVALGAEGELSDRVARSAMLHHMSMKAGNLSLGHVWSLRRLVRSLRPDVVQGWMYHANLMAMLATCGMPVPLAWGIRQSLYAVSNEKRATRAVIKAGAWLSHRPIRVVYNSTLSRQHHAAYGYFDGRGLVIPNGFDTTAFAPDPAARLRLRAELRIGAGALSIGLIARVHPMKDHINFMRAAARFVKLCPQAVFVFAGDGADAANRELMELIAHFRLQDSVRLCGCRSDIAAVNNALDIAASSSWAEAFPNAIAEAMACAVPCVATDVCDVREIVGDTGYVVPARDAIALSDGWAALASLGADGRRSLGERARARIIERYTLESVSKQYANLYASVIGSC